MNQPGRIAVASAMAVCLSSALLAPPSLLGQADVLPAPNILQPVAPARVAARPAVPPAVAPEVVAEQAAVAALGAEIALQQAKIAEHQKVIDEKLAVIAENLRIARIYVSRAK